MKYVLFAFFVLFAFGCGGDGSGGGIPVDVTTSIGTDTPVVLSLEADEWYTPFHLNLGDTLEFTLVGGRVVTIQLQESGYTYLEDEVILLWADLLLDGEPLTITYSTLASFEFQVNEVFNDGVIRIGLDGVRDLGYFTATDFDDGPTTNPNADVRMWVNDATLPIIPNCKP